MNQGRMVLSQVLDFVSKYEFDKCVKKYKGNYRLRTFTLWEQFIVMSFAQLTHRESLRDIEACLMNIGSKRNHSSQKGTISR
jgi:hypothetical protein